MPAKTEQSAARPGGRRSAEHWSNYWAQGRMTSLPQDFRANYDGEIAAFWEDQFAQLPAGATVLDLCTGNGAVALLAAGHSERLGKGLAITAVDAARIEPAALAARHPLAAGPLRSIPFVGEQPLETLAGPDARFDLVCSQYGVEYCDWPAAAAQVARLLRPGGVFAMVSHAASSDLVRTMEAEASEYAVLANLQVEPVLARFLGGTDGHATLFATLEGAVRELERRNRASPSALYRFVLGVMGQILGLDKSTLRAQASSVERFYLDLRGGRERLEDMLRVNRAIAADPDWPRVFQAAGLEALDSGDLHYRGRHHAGRFHRFRRPGE